MHRLRFFLTIAVLGLTAGCQNSPPNAPNQVADAGNGNILSRLIGSNSPKTPNPNTGANGVPLGPNGIPLGQKTKLDVAIEKIMKRGGVLQVEFEFLDKFVVVADLHGFYNAAAALESLAPLTKLRDVNLYNTGFNDADLVLLRGLPNLQTVNLSGTKITDAGLGSLQTLPNIHTLTLNETDVTDAGLQSIRTMTTLTDLSLYGTKVSDQGLAQLRNMTNLRKLVLGGSKSITDRGLLTLQELPQLRELVILSSGVTNPGIDDLKLASHQLKVIH